MNEKVCFIICASDETYLSECIFYINKLECPEDIHVEIQSIWEASSMCAGYNIGMKNSDAKYKVYLHQDVFIKNRNFINDIIKIFKSDLNIGMIGMVGGIGMPQNAVTYLAWNVGCVDTKEPDVSYRMLCSVEQNKDVEVHAIDGLLIATQVDINWREDLFQAFDFYDISQSFEMRKAGYKIVVPFQKQPWVIHACNYAKLKNYDEYRNVCIKEYGHFLTEENDFDFVYHEEWELLSDQLADVVKELVEKHEWERMNEIFSVYHKGKMKNSKLEMFSIMKEIEMNDKKNNVKTFFDGVTTYNDMIKKYMGIRFLLQRIECDMPDEDFSSLKREIETQNVTMDAICSLIICSCLEKEKVLSKLKQWSNEWNNEEFVKRIGILEEGVRKTGIITAYSKRAAKENGLRNDRCKGECNAR